MSKKFWVVAAAAALFAFGCKGDGGGVTSTTPIDANTSSEAVSASTPEVTPTPTPAPPPSGVAGSDWKQYVKFDEQGNLTIQNPLRETYEGEYCYFINGPHPQTRLWAGTTRIPVNQTKTFPVPDLASLVEWGEEQCEVEIQSDAGHKSFDCDRPSNQLADAGLDHLHNYKYFTVKREVGDEWIRGATTTSEGEWGSCDQFPQASTVNPESCFECREVSETTTYTKLCSDEVKTEVADKIERREIECPCVTEWSPWREVDEICGECVEVNGAEGPTCHPEPHCHRPCYLIEERTEKCTQEVERRETNRHFEPCECPTPPGGFCYYNVSGPGGQPGHRIACETKLGGNPLRLGEWGRWPEGPPSDHCRFTVPGIFSDVFRQFQLTPGQSDPRCNRR